MDISVGIRYNSKYKYAKYKYKYFDRETAQVQSGYLNLCTTQAKLPKQIM